MEPKLIIEQKITAFANQYRIFKTGEDGEKSDLAAFAQQKRLAFKEKVSFYNDEVKSQEIFGFRAEKVMDIHGRFFVEDENGNKIGGFKKDFKKSLTSSTWHILNSGGEPQITIYESSKALAIFRRVAGLIPIIGDVAELLLVFLKYHFVLIDTKTGAKIGKYQKITMFRDHYKLYIEDEVYRNQNWKVLAAVAVALDALQSR